MSRLVVCCDGTWNTPSEQSGGLPDPTNVVRFYNVTVEGGASGQRKYYHPGVGSDGGIVERALGGAFGAGLSANIMSAYRWLADHYQPGDDIYLLGFSRGAYTVRSLCGMMNRCGLLDVTNVDESAIWARVQRAYDEGYRKRNVAWAQPGWQLRDPDPNNRVPIRFLGVWDTVGALGVPDDLGLLRLLDNPASYRFHDTALSPTVRTARQALAIDEAREAYVPTLWTAVAPDRDVRQLWFAGCHSDVGGGYLERGLGNCTLKWMLDEASTCGLQLYPNMLKQIVPNPQDVLHDSTAGIFAIVRNAPRGFPCLDSDPAVSDAAASRLANPPIAQAPYHPTTRLDAGANHAVKVYAAQRWNSTGLYLEGGVEYRFEAVGQWLDASIPSGPDGVGEGHLHFGNIVRTIGGLIGKAEPVAQSILHDSDHDLFGTKRIESRPWFELIGVIANGGLDETGDLRPHEIVPIGKGVTHTPTLSGYLYCFANDAWSFYGNNHGSVTLTVSRK